jgi:hypothetical protein
MPIPGIKKLITKRFLRLYIQFNVDFNGLYLSKLYLQACMRPVNFKGIQQQNHKIVCGAYVCLMQLSVSIVNHSRHLKQEPTYIRHDFKFH